MTQTLDIQIGPTELAHRAGDGLEVWLLWEREADRVFVLVVDSRLEDMFELDVDATQAMDAFSHPYAYAAHRGIAYRESRRVAPELEPERTATLV